MARLAVGVASLADAVLLRATGADRRSFLQRVLACDVPAAPGGDSVPGLLLTPKGKVVADFLLAVLPDRIEMRAAPEARPALRDTLARMVIADDCVLEDRAGAAALLSLIGPRAAEAAAGLPGTALPCRRAGLPAVDLLVTAQEQPGALAAAIDAARRLGGGALSAADLEVLRIEAGEPRLGAEAGPDTLPQEAGMTGHVSFTKGCFLGQEPVARLQNRGHTNRGLAGLLLDGPPPAPGTPVLHAGKEVGTVTSACVSPSLGRAIALAILRHEAAAPGTVLEVAGKSASISALPFVR